VIDAHYAGGDANADRESLQHAFRARNSAMICKPCSYGSLGSVLVQRGDSQNRQYPVSRNRRQETVIG